MQQQLQWSDGTFTLLGVDIDVNDLHGKLAVLNMLVYSKLYYYMLTMISPKSDIYTQLAKMTQTFIWDGKRPKIAMDDLTLPKKQGGIKLVDLKLKNSTLKCTWVQQIMNATDEWVDLTYSFFPSLGRLIWNANLYVADAQNLIASPFWQDVLTEWTKVNFHVPKT